jgi:tripartite-type tricarboxylate transporter receptor subunit TctC
VVAHAPADGYTLLLGNNAILATNASLYKEVGFDTEKDFAPITLVGTQANVLVVNNDVPAHSLAELIALAKANPGKLNFAVPNGAPPHIVALTFKALTRADIVVVPYKGAANAITDMIAGQVDAGFETTSVMFALLAAHSLKPLAVMRDRRLPELPDTPTMAESGVPDLTGSSWTGVMGPAGLPLPIVERLRAAIIAGLKSPDMIDKFRKLGAEARFSTQQEFAAFIAEDSRRIAAIIRASGIKGD